ncbi:SusD/RagB family nutrient-binding outer membrane lipoprotein [Chryseolinea sp. T2]|uniref:SusD/RagB family nutrient-binding outer membrane lipoprotein n=1 Tax=Chryseolinea sp. T2 TaxID=3129255 RepID=UPI003076A5B2
MRHLNKFILSALLTTGLVTGCDTDSLHELNINPQTSEELNLNFIFTSVQLGAASGGSAGDNRYIDWRTNIGMCGYAIQHLANAGGGIAPGDKYTENFETSNAPFEFLYGDGLKNVAEILKQTGEGGYDEGNKNNLTQATRIMRAFLFQRLTDYYGSLPYTDALKARAETPIYTPAYDKQKAIYTDLLKELDEASAAMSTTELDQGFGAADLFYEGDVAKWKKFAHSLMLRMAMRVSNVDQALANTYIAKAVAGGVFTSNLDNVYVPMALTPSEWTNQNGISRAFYPGDGGQPAFLSKTLVDWLKGTNLSSTADDDPRLMIISGGIADWTPTDFDVINDNPLEQKGMPNGYDASGLDVLEGHEVDQDETYSKINFKFMQDDEAYQLFNYGEVELMLAEAAERGLGGLSAGDAAAHYNAGVKASMQMYLKYDPSLIVTDAQVTAYLTTYPYAGTPNQKLEMIGEQYWVNHFLNWWEAWSNYRRTGFPALTPTNYPGNLTQGKIPTRLKYPAYEATGNPNYSAGATQPNDYVTKVWWAGGPE